MVETLAELPFIGDQVVCLSHDQAARSGPAGIAGAVTLGVARYSADLDRLSAEFAVAVRSDWHGRGVGYLLMRRLIEVARQSGIGELFGLMLHENRPMLDMCRELGFSFSSEPNDATVLRVRKSLAPV